jgi:NitT/TauT family transport system substrate-binding protein
LRFRRASIGAAVAVVMVATGCTALGARDSTSTSGPLQKVHVSILNSADLPPFWIAKDDGYFAAEGLDVEFDVAKTGDIAQTKAISGESQIVLTTYPLFFVAAASGAADLQIVADGTSASPKSNALLTVPNSPVKHIEDLANRRVAITSKNATSDILTRSVLMDHGVDVNTVKFVPMGLPDMMAALKNNQVDAIYQPEPFIHIAARDIGAFPIIDVATGGTDNFPITGYVATKKWIQANPKAVAAFQRAMAKGVHATSDRTKVNAVVAKYMKTDADIAQLMTLPSYHTDADDSRLQRVPDLLLKLGAISRKVDAAPLIAKQLGD